MKFIALFLVFGVVLLDTAHCKMSKNKQKKYLKQLGYMDEVTGSTEDEKLKKGMSTFQETWDLSVTGELDEATEQLMTQKRCGTSDSAAIKSKKNKGRRSKRYAIFGGAWPKTDLTYRLVNVSTIKSSVSASAAEVRKAIDDAFAVWAAVTPLRFTRIDTRPDIDIYFASGAHCAGGNFDGPGGTLAHAYSNKANFVDDAGFDYAGDAHFDDGENWTLNVVGSGIDVFLVAVHEFGHSLGLGHSRVRGAIMYPFYTYQPSFQLSSDDVDGIQSLYGGPLSSSAPTTPTTTPATTPTTPTGTPGTGPTTPTTTPATRPTTPAATPSTPKTTPSSGIPTLCDGTNIDAMTEDYTNRIFAFKGEYFAVLDSSYTMLAGYPRRIKDYLPELPTNIEAAVYIPDLFMQSCKPSGRCNFSLLERRAVYIFKSGTYYKYKKGVIKSKNFVGSGSISSKFGSGLPNPIDSVFTIAGIRLYFTSGNNYWRVTRGKNNPSVDTDISYPATLTSLATDLPSSGIDATFNAYISGKIRTFFFSGSQYYRITSGDNSVDAASPPYPRSTAAYFFKCSSGTEVQPDGKGAKNSKGKSASAKTKKNKNNASSDILRAQQKVYVNANNQLLRAA